MFDAVSDPKSFRLKTATLKTLLVLVGIFTVGLACSLIYYFSFAYKVFYYDELERKYEQLASDNQRIKGIEREYRKVKQENEKVRIAFGLLKSPPLDTAKQVGSTYEDFTSAKEMGYYPGKDLNDPMHEKMAESIVEQESKSLAGDYMTLSKIVPSVMPVASRFIAREFTRPRPDDSLSGRRSPHIGVDIVAEEGAPVKAASDGWIVIGEWLSDYGNTVVIYHGFGYFTIYKHMQYLLKAQNTFVRSGEVIGTVGKTGQLATGTHLHFEVWRDGAPQDPAEFLPQIKEALRVTVPDSLRKKVY